MSVKKNITQLEVIINLKFPNYKAKFFANRRNTLIDDFKLFLDEINNFLSERLINFEKVYPPKLVLSAKWKHDYIIYSKKSLTEDKLTWEFDNEFITSYIPMNLNSSEHDGLKTWYRQNKCQEFLENTNKHFEQRKIVNFRMINEKLDKKIVQQYQTVNNKKIEQHAIEYRDQIRSSIFCNIQRNDLHVNMSTVRKHFMTDKQKSIG